MEEASVAGESPDRSKQRESSVEPTSGSAGAVPDPRVAASAPRGGVDTATRAFSVRDLKAETPEEPAPAETPDEPALAETPDELTASGTTEEPGETGEAGKPAAGSAAAESAADEAGKAAETADTGKPAKVGAPRPAARTGETEAADEAADEAGDGDGDGVGDKNAADDAAETGTTDKATAAGQASETPEGTSPAKADPRRPVGVTGKTEAAEELSEPEDQRTESTSETTETDETTETGQASRAGTAEEAAKPANADATGKSTEAGPAATDRVAAEVGTAATDRSAADAGADGADRVAVAGASEGVGGASRGSKGVEEGSGGSEAVGGGDERLRAAVAQWVASADEKGSDEGSADAGDGAKERSESGAGAAEAKPASQAGDKSAPKPVSQPVSKSAPKWAAGADEGADEGEGDEPKSDKAESDKAQPGNDESDKAQPGNDGSDKAESGSGKSDKAQPGNDGSDKAESGNDGSDKAESGSGKSDKADESGKAVDGGGGSGVDQPTAVFKAPRPKPAVDQPTTMLKLGGATKPKPDADKADAEPEAAAPAERTSKFVALKPLDEPRPLKPAAKASPEVTALVPQIGPERTTQQPLPPKPPLDLLAELTNTPPPPPTPLRTLGRRIKIWTPLVLLLVVVFAIAQAVRPLPATALTLTAKDSYTFEGGKTQLPWPGEGQGWMDVDGVGTMGGFGQQKPVAIGSVAKTMTAYIILKDHPLKAGEEGPKIEIDATAEKEGGYDVTGDESTLNTVKAGDFLTEKQALSAVLIPSANNIARLLARWDAGSEAAFVKKMNATAKELGMTRTTYTDPSGLKETTVSTAEDQVKLGRAFVQVPALVSISSAASWTDPSGKYWNNYNELPFKTGAIGIKTGSTSAAGGNLLFASRREVNGRSVTLVGAVLGQHKKEILATVNAVSKTALLAAQDALTSAKIVKKGDVVGYVDDKLGHHTPVVVTKDVSAVGWAGMTVKLSFVADEVPHTAKAGAQVGTLTVGDGSGSAVKVPVALQADLVEPGFTDKLTRIG
ncbi:D-alanyl-D-alanine carboxypeptidase [Streptomyces sp. NPDC050121]|uniref:D-alanyl-D-alanine carboxypeptidase n=1 Tax=Streptomyces sp. NPDC050121 TaxID=3365601 RepID=UPI003791DEEB